MNNSINNIRFNRPTPTSSNVKSSSGRSFAGALANGALDTVATVSSVVPGGGLIAAAAKGLQSLTGGDAQSDQMTKMWEMQRENQEFNMQYMELQQQMQADNRQFTTLSNLLKARHETAKSAINNMQV